MRPLALLSLLLAAPALAEPAQMLIWGGGDTQEQAEAVLRGYRKAEHAVHAVVNLNASYPKVVQSTDYPGLKPGFWVVALGICQPLDKELLESLKAVQPQVYARPLSGKAEVACPSLLAKRVTVEKAEVRKKPLVLYAATVEFVQDDTDAAAGQGQPGEFNPAGKSYLLLRNDKTGEVLDLAELEGDEHSGSGSGPGGTEYLTCTAKLEAQGSALVLTRSCDDQNSACGREDHIDRSWVDITRLSISGQAIQRKSSHKVTATTPCLESASGEGD